MNIESLQIQEQELRRLLSAANPDAALLYLYIQSGNTADTAGEDLHMPQSRLSCAAATLRQLGLWPEEKAPVVLSGERPQYSERDVLQAMDTEKGFRRLYCEIQRVLGKNLNTEELKILLGFVRYLGLPEDVISLLVTYCKERARSRGNLRSPSLRAIEKEAYYWAEQGIDTIEEASAFITAQNLRNTKLRQLMELLQIRGRNLTAAEERYAVNWLEMGFDMEALSIAYERTCLNTGALNWPYMNKILLRWHEAGLHTAAAIRAGDRKPATAKTETKPARRRLDADEQAAIARLLQED